MSKLIINDHPFTDEEIQYLNERRRLYDIEQNAIQFPRETEDEQEPVTVTEKSTNEVTIDPEIVNAVKALSEDQLDTELAKIGLQVRGDVKERKFALAKALQANKDASK